jgi:hypothetical protein
VAAAGSLTPKACVAAIFRFLVEAGHAQPVFFDDFDGNDILPHRSHVQSNANVTPPGFYLLFIEYTLNQFAPCELAAYVRVGP